ncbi:dipeptidyl aminopeptidase, partial [Rubrivivax gelatinosus]|nr:dipeptidyl aminopeptidase [Rubrivivax gelatinosus]
MLSVNRYDVDMEPDGSVVDKHAGRVLGARLKADRPTTVWFSERMATIQQTVDKALPDRFNEISCGRCESSRFFTVRSLSDRQPGEYLLYDDEKRSLSPIGSTRPWLDPATQGRRSFHWIKARDGMSLPVVVTHPAGHDEKERLPAVLLVHGGPWVQGTDRSWGRWAQFLAAHGWRVIEPNFRGTLG